MPSGTKRTTFEHRLKQAPGQPLGDFGERDEVDGKVWGQIADAGHTRHSQHAKEKEDEYFQQKHTLAAPLLPSKPQEKPCHHHQNNGGEQSFQGQKGQVEKP